MDIFGAICSADYDSELTEHGADDHIKKSVVIQCRLELTLEKQHWKPNIQSTLKPVFFAHRDYVYIHLPFTFNTFPMFNTNIQHCNIRCMTEK